MRHLVVYCAITLCSLIPRVCFAWGEVGHRVVARIAASQLSPAAQAKVAQILDVENTRAAVADALADAAEWPDSVARSRFPHTTDWHFIDLGVKPNPVKDNPLWASPDTAFARIVKFVRTIKTGVPDELEPGSDLEFLAHLVGDIHQPLHDATNKDRGGNCLFIKFVMDEGDDSERTKFHGAWDRFILEDRLGTGDASIARHLTRDRRAEVASAKTAATSDARRDVSAAVRGWIEDAHALAVNELYGKLRPVVPKFETAPVASDCHNAAPVYRNKTWMVGDTDSQSAFGLIESQLVKAGARLAALLNVIAE